MGATRKWASAHWGILLLAGGAMIGALLLHVGRSVRADQSNSQNVREIHLGRVRPDALYALTVWVKDPAQLQGNDAVLVTVRRRERRSRIQMAARGRPRFLSDPSPAGGGPS